MTLTRLDNLLKKGSSAALDKIIQRAQHMDELTGTLRSALPTETGQNLLAANLRDDGELVLVCASSAWASRIRFETDQLLDTVRQAGLTATSCRVTVAHTDQTSE